LFFPPRWRRLLPLASVRRIVGGREKLPVGGHENAHPRPIRTAHGADEDTSLVRGTSGWNLFGRTIIDTDETGSR
jgi:hypothetical protein